MLVKLEEIVKSRSSFDLLVSKKGIPFKQAYSLAKIHKKILKECELYEKFKNEKIIEIGTQLEDGNYQIEKKHLPQVQKEIQELLEVEIDISGDVIKAELLESCDIEPIVFSDLHWLLVE